MTKRTEDHAKTLVRHWSKVRGTAGRWDIIFDGSQIPEIPEGCTVTLIIEKNDKQPLRYTTTLTPAPEYAELTSDRSADA